PLAQGPPLHPCAPARRRRGPRVRRGDAARARARARLRARKQGARAHGGRLGAGDPARGDGSGRHDRRAARTLAEALRRMIRGRAMPRGVRVAALVLPVLLAGAARAEITNRIVATIDGEPVTAHELRQYAKEHAAPGTPDARVLEALITAERVQVRDIFLAIEDPADEASAAHARAKALEVRALALDGHDFGALAEQFSEGPGARKGGELGTFGRGEMEHDLESAAFALEAGKVSEPVRAGGGFHLLRVDQRIGAGHRPLDEV